ncbi:MAG: response regulator [Promethearchaeota archaeon]
MVKKKILIVSRNKYLLQQTRSLLRNAKFMNIVGSSSGTEGIKLYKENNIGLILCDVKLTGMKALTFQQNILAYDDEAKVIMIYHQERNKNKNKKNKNKENAREKEEESILQILQSGVIDIIYPVHQTNFICVVRRVLERDRINTDGKFLLEIFSQIIEDIDKYLDHSVSIEIQSQIGFILRSVEIDYPKVLFYNEKRNRIQIREGRTVSFSKLNEILIIILDKITAKIQNYLPHAKNIIIEAFRMVYYRNLGRIESIENAIIYPDWLKNEVNWVNQILCFICVKNV